MGPRWYVVRTKPRSEHLAAGELDRVGIEHYAPLVKRPQAGACTADSPLFPGYLFLRCDPEAESWPSFHQAQYIAGWVNFRGEIPSLPDEVIANLKRRCDEINQEGGIWKRYVPGERVHIVSPTISGFAQVVEDGKTAQSPVKVLLQFLDRLVPAQVPRESVQPIDRSDEIKVHAPRRTRGRGRWVRGFGPQALPAG